MSFNNTPPTIEQLQAQYAATLELQQRRRQEEDERAAWEYELAMVELKRREDEERRQRESAMLEEVRAEERRREVIIGRKEYKTICKILKFNKSKVGNGDKRDCIDVGRWKRSVFNKNNRIEAKQ